MRYDRTVRRVAAAVAVLAAAGVAVTGCKRTPVAIGTVRGLGHAVGQPEYQHFRHGRRHRLRQRHGVGRQRVR